MLRRQRSRGKDLPGAVITKAHRVDGTFRSGVSSRCDYPGGARNRVEIFRIGRAADELHISGGIAGLGGLGTKRVPVYKTKHRREEHEHSQHGAPPGFRDALKYTSAGRRPGPSWRRSGWRKAGRCARWPRRLRYPSVGGPVARPLPTSMIPIPAATREVRSWQARWSFFAGSPDSDHGAEPSRHRGRRLREAVEALETSTTLNARTLESGQP